MIEGIEKLIVQRVTRDSKQDNEEAVIKELPLTIVLNHRELVTLLCSPADLNYLAVGFLASEGLLKSKKDIKKIVVDSQRGVVRVETRNGTEDTEGVFKRMITSGCGRGASFYSAADVEQVKVESSLTIPANMVFNLVREFQRQSETYHATGGVHSAALCDIENILIFNEDIGRHNAIDKIIGECVLKDIPMTDRLVITSGRISSEILLKIARRQVPLLISRSAPTSLGVKLANDLGVTLIGFVRGERMNVYTNGWRVITGDGR